MQERQEGGRDPYIIMLRHTCDEEVLQLSHGGDLQLTLQRLVGDDLRTGAHQHAHEATAIVGPCGELPPVVTVVTLSLGTTLRLELQRTSSCSAGGTQKTLSALQHI